MSEAEAVVTVENLGKRYTLNAEGHGGSSNVREGISRGLSGAVRRLVRGASGPTLQSKDFWALRDVNFSLKEGEAIGIIGRNGAGKSTLLKLLSRITQPTTGRIRLKGRVASLLEVGTGFHPELSGRENIFLNGAILGMTRRDVQARFDEIVEFSGVSRFLDMPLKHYSSGMYARLAFSVAAHLEPDILIVDEVLSVGDAEFQRRCMGRMNEVANSGRTILFVSHNLPAVESLCTRAICLINGRTDYDGMPRDAIRRYLNKDHAEPIDISRRTDRLGDGRVRIDAIEFSDADGKVIDSPMTGQTVDVHLHFHTTPGVRVENALVGINFRSMYDMGILLQHNGLTRTDFGPLPERGIFTCRFERFPLVPGAYSLTFAVMPDWGAREEYIDLIANAVEVTVTPGDWYGTGQLPSEGHATMVVDATWKMREAGVAATHAERQLEKST